MDAFIGEVRPFTGDFAPKNWAFCQGQLMSISQFATLFSLLGTTFGGDGTSTFALPNLVMRVPAGCDLANQGQGQSPIPSSPIGTAAGNATATLSLSTMPAHSHTATFSPNGTASITPTVSLAVSTATQQYTDQPAGAMLAQTPQNMHSIMVPPAARTTNGDLAGVSVPSVTAGTVTGGALVLQPAGTSTPAPFPTQMPYLAINFIICIYGIVPPRG